MGLPLPIPDRNCGACGACCIELAIDDPALTKAAGVTCAHLVLGKGCSLHPHHPRTCQTWICGWRFLQLSDAMRPDRSKILLVPELGSDPRYAKGGLKVVLMGDDKAALANDELLNLLAKCTLADIPVFLTYGTGFAKQVRINEAAKPIIKEGRKHAFLQYLQELHDDMAAASAEVRPGQ